MGRGRERSKGREKKRFPIGELVMHLLLLLFLKGAFNLLFSCCNLQNKQTKEVTDQVQMGDSGWGFGGE